MKPLISSKGPWVSGSSVTFLPVRILMASVSHVSHPHSCAVRSTTVVACILLVTGGVKDPSHTCLLPWIFFSLVCVVVFGPFLDFGKTENIHTILSYILFLFWGRLKVSRLFRAIYYSSFKDSSVFALPSESSESAPDVLLSPDIYSPTTSQPTFIRPAELEPYSPRISTRGLPHQDH